MTKIAVILSGCGFLDGAEIRESVLTLLALDKLGAKYTCFAPDIPQHHVVDHSLKNETSEKRNILAESARIARGEILPLSKLDTSKFDAVIFPGGYGVAKNLCTFAFNGSKATVLPELKKVIEEFHQQSKPIGAICIAPALISLVLGKFGIKVTIGNDQETAQEISKTGAKHENCPVNQCLIDHNNKIVTTPAYMLEAKLHEISAGIESLVDSVIKLA